MTQSNPSIEITDASTKSRDRWLIALLAVAVFALYLPTRHFGFVGYDDYLYVYENLHVQQGLSADSIRWAMSAIVVANWHPLTILTELTIVQFFGPVAGAFHMVNALLHTLSVILLFQFLRSATGRLWPAFFTAVLWGLHPLRVESVAWISELKDVLCGSLWLGCMLAYLHYSRNRTFGRYAVCVPVAGARAARKTDGRHIARGAAAAGHLAAEFSSKNKYQPARLAVPHSRKTPAACGLHRRHALRHPHTRPRCELTFHQSSRWG